MEKPLFSIVVICKNEQNTLPRLFESLTEFRKRGGEVVVLDTGSTDNTVEIAEQYKANVFRGEHGFVSKLNDFECMEINEEFVKGNDSQVVKFGDRLFDFSAARNHVTNLASNDFVITLDADEAYSVFDIDAINQAIKDGYEQFEYQFVYAHDANGNPVVQFIQSKAFDRRKVSWTGIVHEVLTGNAKIKYFDESIIKLEHWQEQGKEHRGNYLAGLAYDCLKKPGNDRQRHYFARELMYTGRHLSAISQFEIHVGMNKWPAERAQSLIYMGDCYGKLNNPKEQTRCYSEAFMVDSSRREALIKLASFYQHNNNHKGAAAYAAAALQIPWVDYYANDRSHYEYVPHEILYQALGWIGNIKGAQDHLLECLKYQPHNSKFNHDTRYYFEYPVPDIEGWMTFEELTWLYNNAQGKDEIIEIGSWKGRSTHALCSGALKTGGKVTAVDTWQGSDDVRDDTNRLAKQDDIYAIFEKNVGHFENLTAHREATPFAARHFEDMSADLVFIDAGHLYMDVLMDIAAWLPKVAPDGIISGHDYLPGTWMSVVEAVNDVFGEPDRVTGTIWQVFLEGRNIEALTKKAIQLSYEKR